MTEEEVFRESNGGHGNMTAFWVVYVNGDIGQETKLNDLNTYKQGEPIADQTHAYSKFFSGEIRMLVDDDNKKFGDEMGEYKLSQQVKLVQKKYDEKYNEL